MTTVLILLLLAFLLLTTERLRADMVAMLILVALMFTGILSPQQALSGFANPATVTVACMFVISAGLQSSGVVQFLGDRLLRHGPTGEVSLLMLAGLIIAPVSAFINNTAAVAVFLPVVLRACHGNRISPSNLMMPLSFFAMLGGTCTLIGTSTNILVSSIAADHGYQPFGMFEFTAMCSIILVAGGGYLIFFGRHLLVERIKAESLTEGFHLNLYLSEVIVLPGSTLIGQTIVGARLGERFELEVLGHVRDKVLRAALGHERLLQEDILLVKAPAAALMQLRDAAGLAVRPRRPGDADLRSGDSALIEGVISPNSDLEGRSLKEVDFRNRFGASALAIRRHGEDIREKIGRVRMRVGDELLILAPRRNLPRLRRQRSFVMLEELEVPVVKPLAALTAIGVVVGVVLITALGWYPIVQSAIAGAVAMVITGCVPVRRVYDQIEWSVIFLLAGLIPLGLALEKTGAAAQAGQWLLALAGSWSTLR